MTDDERLARQLQEEENGRGSPGNPVQATVVQGSVVQGTYPAGAVPGIQQGIAVQGTPTQIAGGMQGGTPGLIGVPYGGDMPYVVSVPPEIPPEEAVVLNYRISLKCFTCVDCFSTIMNGVAVVRSFLESSDSSFEGSQPSSSRAEAAGRLINDPTLSKTISLASLLLIVGPICGWFGASRLQRNLVMVYLFFCVIKTAFEILLALATPNLWYILIALIQVWVTRIVFSFWKALGSLPPEKLEQMRDPNYVPEFTPRVVYW